MDGPKSISQQLLMTPQLQQAIKMLSMNLEELLLEIDRQRKENPVLSIQTRTTRPIGPFPPDLETLPELYVYLEGGAANVEPNINALPDMFAGNKIIPVQEADDSAPFVEQFPEDQREKVREAAWLARAVQQRARTYVKIITEIVKSGPQWFKDEYAEPPKITQKEIAEAVGMHESTIARVLGGNKVLRCERGLVRFDELIGAKKKEGFGI